MNEKEKAAADMLLNAIVTADNADRALTYARAYSDLMDAVKTRLEACRYV